MSLITINGNSFDPDAPVAQSLGLNKESAPDTDYIILQTTGEPLKKVQKAEIQEKGAQIQEYVSDNTYLCHYKATDLDKFRNLAYIKYANVYLQKFVVQPTLRTATDPSSNAIGLSATRKTRTAKEVDIIIHDDVDSSQSLRDELAEVAHADPDSLASFNGKKLRISLQEQYLDDIAAIDAVKFIQEVHPAKLYNNVASKILNTDVLINGTSYKGKGQVVCVADTGFDTGDKTNCHDAFGNRVSQLFDRGRPGKFDDPDGHGTHVCGSVLGSGKHTSEGAIEAPASESRLVMQSLLGRNNGLTGIPADLNELFQQGYDAGARIHTNSWGRSPPAFGSQLPYDSNSSDIDNFVHRNPEMVILFAAGNDGADRDNSGRIDSASIGSQAAAKNCITVGATESERPNIEVGSGGTQPTWGMYWPSDYPKAPIFNDHIANDRDGMAAFSSRGPTKEQRFKPDVVAPGSAILSARSSQVRRMSDMWGKSSDPKWCYLGGTSMATPLVAGCCAVLREILIKNHKITNPTAALVKAVLINGAVDVTGQYFPSEAGPSPNNASGFGRVDLSKSISEKDSKLFGCFQSKKPLDDEEGNDEFTFDIPIPETIGSDPTTSAKSLKITLAWSDPPGYMLQNDLDLIVAVGGIERHGNMGSKAGFDRLNNVEQVNWIDIPHGNTAKVTIKVHRITKESQHFACAWRIY